AVSTLRGTSKRPGSGSASGSVGTSNVTDLWTLRLNSTKFQGDGKWRQPHGGFRGNARAPLEHGLAGLIRIRQHRGIDVDHHLVPPGTARPARRDRARDAGPSPRAGPARPLAAGPWLAWLQTH